MRDLGFDAVVTLSLVDPGLPRAAAARPTTIRARADPGLQPALARSTPSCGRRCSARCSTRPATTSPAAPSASPCSSPAAPTSPRAARRAGGPLAGSFAGRAAPPAFEPQCIAASPSARWRRRAGAAEQRPADFFALKGVLEALAAPARRATSRSSPTAQPFLHPGRAARVAARRRARPAGSARSTRSSAASWDLERGEPASRSTSRELVAAASIGREQLRGRHHLSRASTRTSRSWSARTCRRRGCARRCSAGGGELLRGADGLRPLPRRAGRRGAQEPRAAARVPGPRPHPHRRRGGRAARGDQGGAGGDRGGAP